MSNRKPLQLKRLFLLHNFFLSITSVILLALFLEQIVPTIARNGLHCAICDLEGGWTKPMVVLYYVCPTQFVIFPGVLIRRDS